MLYHKREPVSQRQKAKQTQIKEKQFVSFMRRKKFMILILVQNVDERKETYFRNLNISQIISWVCHVKNNLKML